MTPTVPSQPIGHPDLEGQTPPQHVQPEQGSRTIEDETLRQSSPLSPRTSDQSAGDAPENAPEEA